MNHDTIRTWMGGVPGGDPLGAGIMRYLPSQKHRATSESQIPDASTGYQQGEVRNAGLKNGSEVCEDGIAAFLKDWTLESLTNAS